ncbi:hypothetical protein N7489_010793 [Penicillium chrysogenum]|uniref:uncharacterized protein n=1 Tax=Penicillium chrysogenum TaxID=5076 RepID=UPI00239B2300|nr:uncharacterized protein N7489_010793 [Penicillium chrysogenum]KAJ5230085.1 hypothetical protein N7489_010793 [Penicillium chrysogenum]KAJ5271758.1 hypothetical protein N7524_005027 [Penicillium chrysogenum]
MIAIPSSFHHSATSRLCTAVLSGRPVATLSFQGNEKDEASTDGEIVRGRETQDNSAREGWAAKAKARCVITDKSR